ncbi:MAG TPA: ABC transporter substrate-binding protein [Xanthobacteraceae bacterium]
MWSKSCILAAAVAALAQFANVPAADAADAVRVGKAVPFAWTFTPVEVGLEAGIWAKHGLQPQVTGFGGDARMQQALTAHSIDFGLGSGPGMGFMAKGVPAKAVAAFATSPRNLALVVGPNSPITDVSQTKGKKFGITTVGSLTDWLLKRMALAQGWKHDDVIAVPLGGLETSLAGLKTGQVDGLVLATEVSYGLEEKKEAKIIANFGSYAPKFHTHVIFARNELIEKQPDVVKRFVTAWFETIAWMKANRQKTIEITGKLIRLSPAVAARTYDEEIGMLKDDGRFDPEAIALIKTSLVEMKILEAVPADEVMFTTKFVQ